ncbi:DUF3089 domain-containing protein [Sphingomonas swuensis]|uniref:DUF3089 domain-containing protein n=1 Tax=Sphingomonas swuensis TaxID=977800 RepID=A0ABP7TB39_9SPHN
MSLLLALAAQAAAAQPAPPAAPDYRRSEHWLCLPGQKDVCNTPLPTTALTPRGYGSNGPSTVASGPKLDCFYVYPTVSQDRGMNSDLVVSEEKAAASSQFARFSGVCRPYAPVYRQMTSAAIGAAALGRDIMPNFAIAYGDVREAFRNFRARNRGRPFVLVGHSQGSWLLQRLIAEEIEGKPNASEMALAIIPGFNVLVPDGKTIGGTFKSTPLCERAGQRGCVVSYVSFRTNNPPPPGALFGYAPAPGMTVACTNPAALGSRGWAKMDSYWPTRTTYAVPGGPIRWSTEGAPPTPFVRTEGLASGRCVNAGPRGYLEVRTNVTPGAKWSDRIGGEVGVGGLFIPGWGMHLADVPVAQGDLLGLVEAVAR